MRRIVAGLLLATQLTWPTPSPSLERFDWPGQQESSTDQIWELRQQFPKARDWAGFFLLGNPN